MRKGQLMCCQSIRRVLQHTESLCSTYTDTRTLLPRNTMGNRVSMYVLDVPQKMRCFKLF